jgi:hypothetical protein
MSSLANSVGLRQPVIESLNELDLGGLDVWTLTVYTDALCTITEARQDPDPAVVPGSIVKAEYPPHPLAFNLYDIVAALECAEFRSLWPPYLTNTNANSHLDIMRLALAVHEFEPENLEIPQQANGAPTFKLDRLAPADGFLHSNAHDAMADVEATIFLARFMRERVPWLWDHLLKMGQKTEAVRRAREAPVRLYTDFFYNKPNHWLVSAIAVTREKSASVAGAGQSIENQFRKPI